MKIGVTLNHYEPHQVPHVVPFVFVVSELHRDWSVHILCSTLLEEEFARAIAKLYSTHRCKIERLNVPIYARLVDLLVRQVTFYRKFAIQKVNISLFTTFDALLAPEITNLSLRENEETNRVKLIFTGHGAEDDCNQNVGMFDLRAETFDLTLSLGRKIVDKLKARGRNLMADVQFSSRCGAMAIIGFLERGKVSERWH